MVKDRTEKDSEAFLLIMAMEVTGLFFMLFIESVGVLGKHYAILLLTKHKVAKGQMSSSANYTNFELIKFFTHIFRYHGIELQFKISSTVLHSGV